MGQNIEIPEVFRTVLREKKFWLYGTGKLAEEAYAYIEEYGLTDNIEGVLVSTEYWSEGNTFHGMNIEKFDEKTLYDNIVVIFSPLKYGKVVKMLIESSNIGKIYIFYSWKMFLENKWMGFGNDKCYFIDNYYEIYQKRGLTKAFYNQNRRLFEQTKAWLDDELSRETFERYVNGHMNVKNYPMLDVWTQKDVRDQYFPNIINFSQNEVVLDCGAYTGDTFISYIYHVGKVRKYYAFEPDKTVYEKLVDNTYLYSNVKIIQKGVSDKIGEAGYNISDSCSCIMENAENRIDITTIDHEIEGDVSFIKMDIEGEELNALKGAENTILKYKPKLAICVYHKKEDLISIPQYIKALRPDYKLYLRAHEPTLSEVVLYAV